MCFRLLAPFLLVSSLASAQQGSGYLGVGLINLTPEIAQQIGVEAESGAVIAHVEPDSPASRAGLKRGETIVSLGGETIRNVQAVADRVRSSAPGDALRMGIVSKTGKRTVDVRIGNRQVRALAPAPPLAPKPVEPLEFDVPRMVKVVRNRSLGVTLEAIDGQLADYFGVDEAVLVREVDADGPAARAGLQAGDAIVGVNGVETNKPEEVRHQLGRAAGEASMLEIARRGKRLRVQVEPQRLLPDPMPR